MNSVLSCFWISGILFYAFLLVFNIRVSHVTESEERHESLASPEKHPSSSPRGIPAVVQSVGTTAEKRALTTQTETAAVGGIMKKNAIQLENELPGSPDWVLANPALNREVEGYMSRTSVQKGEKILLYYSVNNAAKTNETTTTTGASATKVKIEVFRTGWYGGVGGRKVFGPVEVPGIAQKMPQLGRDGVIECRWTDPYTLETEDSWTTGVYLLKMTESRSDAQSYAIFVVRDDERVADVMFQLPVTTYQAYNIWGGKNLYRCNLYKQCQGAQRASFDRPYAGPENKAGAFGTGAAEYLSNVQPYETYPIKTTASWNYNMVRWMERNSLDVTYITNIDVHTNLLDLNKPRLFLTQGHDEYWSWAMRDHVASWRDDGVHLAFLGSNTAYWQIRFEDDDEGRAAAAEGGGGSDAAAENHHPPAEPRTFVCYRRENKDPDKSRYRSVKFRQVRPEALLIGVEYVFPLGDPFDDDMVVADHSHWIFNDTGVNKGDKIPGMLGYEVDRIRPDALKPMDGNTEEAIYDIATIFETPLVNRKNKRFLSHGSMYRARSGAHVFGAGTMQWSWGLDDFGVEQGLRTSRLSKIIETMTWNLLAAAGIESSSRSSSTSGGADGLSGDRELSPQTKN